MVEYSKINEKLTDTQLKKLKTAENEFKNVWWKWSASWIITDNKTKKQS